MNKPFAALILLPLTLVAASARDLPKEVKIPAGFEATYFAGPPDIGYPTCLAAAPTGELYVGVDENGSLDAKPKRGRVVRCSDTNGDGVADQFVTFAEMDSPRGLWFDRNTLYVMHPPSVTAYIDDDGDGKADRSEELVRGLGFDLNFRGADHTVNGMRMAIDGWLYIAVGDYGAIKAVGKDGTELQLHGGGVARVRPDGSGLELVSRGQRNIYDVAVSPELDLFTRDNTNDGDGWDVRLSHVVMTGNYGYPSLFKKFGDEIIQPLADYGGGSPCGSLYMDEPGWPEGFGKGLYTCEWGRSFVFRHPLARNGSSFTAKQEPFVEIPRPTDMDVDGQSRVYVASWAGGGFNYSGPNVGYVVRLQPQGHKPAAFPDLKKLGDEALADLLRAHSAVWRLHAQREILRRGAKPGVADRLAKLAESDGDLAPRIAALFALKQLLGAEATGPLMALSEIPALREFALRAAADHLGQTANVPLKPYLAGLEDKEERVRLQCAVALGRLGRAESAQQLVPHLADPDAVVAHASANALVKLRAIDVCLNALDSADSARLLPGLRRVLQSLHDMSVVNGLADRLARADNEAKKEMITATLSRLYNREADWDGKWWGTRPDTTGPYFKPVKWEGSAKVGETLRGVLAGANDRTLPDLIAGFQKNRVDLPELVSMVLSLASKRPDYHAAAVEFLATRSPMPEEALGFLEGVSATPTEPVALRAKSIKLLQGSAKGDSLDKLVAVLAGVDAKDESELGKAYSEFVREPRHAQNRAYFMKLASADSAPKRTLAYAVLVNLASSRVSGKEAKADANKSIEQAWSHPDASVSLLHAIARTKSEAFNYQVSRRLADSREEVRAAATAAAQQLKLDQARSDSAGPKLETLALPAVVDLVAKETGDARAGAQLFVRQGCVACHTVSSEEAPKGPFLGGIATRYSRAELCESILKPSAKIAQGFETQWFATKGEEEFEGFVVREGGDDLDVRSIQGITTTLAKKDIKSRGKRETSMMPEGLVDKLTPKELASLLSYLEGLKAK